LLHLLAVRVLLLQLLALILLLLVELVSFVLLLLLQLVHLLLRREVRRGIILRPGSVKPNRRQPGGGAQKQPAAYTKGHLE
jgi:hypothetical protein